MCRLYGFIANEPTKVDCSLVFAQNALMMQSLVDERGLHHADGWGIATYQDGRPVLQKKTTAAFEDQNFSAAAEKVYSSTIIAHVRKATVGENSLENTHPFVSSSWTFAHNGTLTGFAEFRELLEAETTTELQSQRAGTTDSEQYFLWLLSRLQKADLDGRSNEDGLRRFITRSVALIDERCRTHQPDKLPGLNFLLTDGEVMISCRWNNTLHVVRRNGIYDCEICGIPHVHHDESVAHRAVVIASEPVNQEEWQEVSDRSILITRI